MAILMLFQKEMKNQFIFVYYNATLWMWWWHSGHLRTLSQVRLKWPTWLCLVASLTVFWFCRTWPNYLCFYHQIILIILSYIWIVLFYFWCIVTLSKKIVFIFMCWISKIKNEVEYSTILFCKQVKYDMRWYDNIVTK